jgi:ribonuclease HI
LFPVVIFCNISAVKFKFDFLKKKKNLSSYVRTPHSQKIWKKKRYRGFPAASDEAKALFFDAVRGAGQGDVGSPINWDAVFDILLCALSSVEGDRFYIHGSSERIYPSQDIAYADDLLSGMSSIEGLQEKAKIVSAFAIIFGLDIAKSKLRSFIHNSHDTKHVPQAFNIYTSGWIEHSVPIASTGSLKALGMVYDISSSQLHKSQFELSKVKAERSCNIIRRSRGSRAQLATVVSTCVMKRAEYTGKFSANTDSQTQELDKVFTHAFKDLTLNLTSFPDALIYLPRNLGGLGFPKLSDCVGEAKYSIQQRHLHAQGMVANTMDTLLYNGVVQSSQTPYADTGVIVAAPQELSPNFWANSLLKFADEGDISLCRQGPFPRRSSTTSFVTGARTSSQQQTWRFVDTRNISVLGDLYSYIPGSPPVWHDFSNTSGRVLAELQQGVPPADLITLRSKQFWLPSSDAKDHFTNEIIEILGFTEGESPLVNYRLLETNVKEQAASMLSYIRPPETDTLLGGASEHSLPAIEVLGSSPSRVYLNPPPKGSKMRQIGFISSPTGYQTPKELSSNLPWIPSEVILALPLLGPFSIFSDGSWSPSGPPHSHVTGHNATHHGAAGIAILSDLPNWRELPILTFQIDNGQDLGAIAAYSMEVLGILVSLSIASHVPDMEVTICSDCQSAVTKLQKNRHRTTAIRAKTRDASLLGAAISLWKDNGNVKIKWVKGHPEKEVTDASEWTREMWGNHLSDRAAAGVLGPIYQYQNLLSNMLVLTPLPPMEALTVTANLVPNGTWYFGNSKGQLISSSIVERIHNKRLTRYLAERDELRAKRLLPAKWSNFVLPLTAKLWGIATSPNMRGMKVRLMFDKHCHPGNLAKKHKDIDVFELAAECPFCAESDSASHWSVQCTALPRNNDIRNAAITHIKAMITGEIGQHTAQESIAAIRHLGDDYLSFLIGHRKSPEVWMGLWTPDQLDVFGSNAYYPFPLVAALKKLFLAIGTYLTETVIKIWQSRQTAECELAAAHQKTPIPNYKEPSHLFNPTKSNIPAHSEMEMEDIVRSASVVAPVRAQKVNNSSTTKRKLKPRIASVDATLQTDTLEDSTGRVPPVVPVVPPVVQVTDLSDAVTSTVLPQDIAEYNSIFKPAKKLPKRKAGWTLEQRFVNAVAKKSQTHWRVAKRELPKEKAKTSVVSFLNLHGTKEPTPRRQKQSKPNKGPRVPVQPTLKPSPKVEGDVNTGSSALLTALHSPVRGHDPSAICWHLSRISSSYSSFCVCFLAHDRFTELV